MIHSYGLFKALNNVLSPATVKAVVVVGCCPVSGSHEIDWFLKHYPKAKIYGFEPCPDNYEGLWHRYGGHLRVSLYKIAVADFVGKAKFHISNIPGAHSLLPWNESSDCKPASWRTTDVIETPTCRLDRFCENMGLDRIDLLFMDAQGAEYLVIRGAGELRRKGRLKVIIGEAIFTDIYDDPHSFADVYNMLARTGLYEFRGFYRPVYAQSGKLHHCDYMFVRKGE